MTREEREVAIKVIRNFPVESTGERKAVLTAIKALEQEPCEDAISRQAVEDKLLRLVNELEEIFADIREKNVDDSVCGLCEYDCDHGIDGSAFECPGFETDECFKLADKIRHEWQSTKDLPPVNPQPKTGHWIEIAQYSDGNHKIECSECGSHIFDRGHANSFNVKNKYKFCPNCGAKMSEIPTGSESEGEE